VKLPTTDPNLARMLVDGRPVDPIAGRADDFRWPRPNAINAPAADEGKDAAKAEETLRPVMAEPKDAKKNAPAR
jgi:hypothetical protein